MGDRILLRIAAENPLQSLTPQGQRADTLPVTRDPQPNPCKAWVRFGPHAMQVDADVVVWDGVACGIQFTCMDRSDMSRCLAEIRGLQESNVRRPRGTVPREMSITRSG